MAVEIGYGLVAVESARAELKTTCQHLRTAALVACMQVCGVRKLLHTDEVPIILNFC